MSQRRTPITASRLTRMGEPRTFSVCQGCGAWRETRSDLMSFFSDYDMPFFIEHHAARCPVTGKPQALVSVSEDDPNYEPLAPEKQWQPESCPDYRPRQEPKFARYTTDVPERVIGVWVADSGVGGAYDETMVLSPRGDGSLDFWNMGAYCGRRSFKWRLESVEHICFEGTHNYFRTERAYFEVGSFTNIRGDETDMLRIFDRGADGEPTAFYRSRQSFDEYKGENHDRWRNVNE